MFLHVEAQRPNEGGKQNPVKKDVAAVYVVCGLWRSLTSINTH